MMGLCIFDLHVQGVPVLNGRVTMDSVSHPPNVVMETGSVLMAVTNSTAVSAELLACFFVYIIDIIGVNCIRN